MERALAIRRLQAQTAELLQLAAAESWDQAMALAQTRHADMVLACAGMPTAAERDQLAGILRGLMDADRRLLDGLRQQRSECLHKLQDLQQSRHAVQAYGQSRA